MTISQILNEINKKIDYENSEILLQFVLNCNKNFLIVNKDNDISKENVELIKKYVNQIIEGKPIQYITNYQYFFENKFYVNEDVLIPQPDTEVLVEKAIEIIKKEKVKKVLDLCTGSGAIAISIKKQCQNVDMVASDISDKALEVAEKNAKNILDKNNRIEFVKSDLFSNIKGKFDLIVSNPPYIETEIIKDLDKAVQREPIIALDGGDDGLFYYKKIREKIDNYLEGTLLLEIGYNQKESISNIFEGCVCYKDYGNNDRIIEWRN